MVIERATHETEGHLEHVLDVYIGGYFIANLRIGPVDLDPRAFHRAAVHVAGQVELGPSRKAMSDFSPRMRWPRCFTTPA